MNLNVLRWNDVFALGRYVPLLSLAFQKDKKVQNPADMTHSRRVYAFKKHGKHTKDFKSAVLSLKSDFACDDVLAVPRSSLESSRLQELFGVKIERLIPVEQRKVKHSAALPPNYSDTYTIHRDRVAGHRLLLIDDIVTTGTTLKHFAEALRSAGFEVVSAALAFDHKIQALTIAHALTVTAAKKIQAVETPTQAAEVERMARLGASNQMIADALYVNEKTIRRKYGAIVKQARAVRRVKVLELQMLAAEKGNPAMLIWLGKNDLGQMDAPAPREEIATETPVLQIVRKLPPAPVAAVTGG